MTTTQTRPTDAEWEARFETPAAQAAAAAFLLAVANLEEAKRKAARN